MEKFSEPLDLIDKANELIKNYGTVDISIDACDHMLWLFRHDQSELRFWQSVKQELLNIKYR